MGKRAWAVVLVATAMVAVGCQTAAPPSDPVPANPDHAVAELKAAWMSAPTGDFYGSHTCEDGRPIRSRAMIRRQAQNLAFRHPYHAPTLFLNGVLAYEAGDPDAAARFIDYGLKQDPTAAARG